MNTNKLRRHGVIIALSTVIVVMALLGSYRESTRVGEPEFTAENVARFYAAGMTGLVIDVSGKEDVSAELGAIEAYRFTVTAEGFEGEAQLVVAKTDAGGWVVVPQQAEGG